MVNAVEPNGPAALAGLKVGDVITKINGDAPTRAPFQTFAGKTITLTVSRDGAETEMPMKVGSSDSIAYSLTDLPNISAKQAEIREGWLKR